MRRKKYKELLSKLDAVTGNDNSPVLIEKNMDLGKYTTNQLYMIHAHLHMFYPKGTDALTKTDIEQLHINVKKKITHENRFDQLDDIK